MPTESLQDVTIADVRALLRRCDDLVSASDATTYLIVGEVVAGKGRILIARSPRHHGCFLVCGLEATAAPGLSTKRLAALPVNELAVTSNGSTATLHAAILECSDPEMHEVFAVLGCQILQWLSDASTWSGLRELLVRWSTLFAEGRPLDDRMARGLWGELWVLANNERVEELAAGWRGPDGGVADFVLGAGALEVKTSARPFEHHLSHAQTQLDGNVSFLLSLAAENSDGGLSTADLLAKAILGAGDGSSMYDAMVRRGISWDAVRRSEQRFVLLATPTLFRITDVPTVRQVDAGVTELHYKVTLDPRRALDGADLVAAAGRFGLGMILVGD